MVDEEAALWRRLIEVSERRGYDGHLTILKFSTNWRIGFRTPADREEIGKLSEGETFITAARRALALAEGRGESSL
jgi:hypothetical protein